MKAQNQGEGAYEAELIVSIPPQADFIGVVRNNEVSKLAVSLKTSAHLLPLFTFMRWSVFSKPKLSHSETKLLDNIVTILHNSFQACALHNVLLWSY